ncbi:hypothetical protein IM538_13065 [Cytobacillus suaedae]|nr:hypothetical protein IM538_13065 [Cytobacillus suaedae]
MMFMVFILLGLTFLVVGGATYVVLKKSKSFLYDVPTCLLCGKEVKKLLHSHKVVGLIETEHKCVKCGGRMELKT